MCPVCLTAGGLYVAGGASAGAVTTFLATRWLRKRGESTASMTSPGANRESRAPMRSMLRRSVPVAQNDEGD